MDCFWLVVANVYKYYLAPTLTPIVIIVGWIYVSLDNDRRETRKEIRTLINDVATKLDTLHDETTRYFCKVDNQNDVDAIRTEVHIKQSIERLDGILQVLAKMDKRFDRASKFLDRLASDVTGHAKFESRTFVGTVQHNDEALLTIALARKDLQTELEQVYLDSQVRKRR